MVQVCLNETFSILNDYEICRQCVFIPGTMVVFIILLFLLFGISFVADCYDRYNSRQPKPLLWPLPQFSKDAYFSKSVQGRRAHMEDRMVVTRHPSNGMSFIVLDGHRGHECVDFVMDRLPIAITTTSTASKTPLNVDLLKQCISNVDQEWISDHKTDNSGTCVIAAYIQDDNLFVINVGDCRAILGSNDKTIISLKPLSVDHKPYSESERKRISDAGGIVTCEENQTTWRVEGDLAVSRAIGDNHLKKWVISLPDIIEHKISLQDEFLILGSDGLWDAMTNGDACHIARSQPTIKDATNELINFALKRSGDNITCMIIDLRYFIKQK